uniref:Uncharacterized protein n=1 Tax=Rhizophora mucronata TaxID=61149 RepID=A0A2P2PQ94_RHIMU
MPCKETRMARINRCIMRKRELMFLKSIFLSSLF